MTSRNNRHNMTRLREAERAQGHSVTEDLAVMQRNLERATNLRDISLIDEHLRECTLEAAQPRDDGDNLDRVMDYAHLSAGLTSTATQTEDLRGESYGALPAPLTREEHLEAFDRELVRLPMTQKDALLQAYTAKQALSFLHNENNDARLAAKNMAMFWEMRFKLYGNDTFLDGLMPRSQEDFRRVYEMALKALFDPEVDEETRRWAKRYANEWDEDT